MLILTSLVLMDGPPPIGAIFVVLSIEFTFKTVKASFDMMDPCDPKSIAVLNIMLFPEPAVACTSAVPNNTVLLSLDVYTPTESSFSIRLLQFWLRSY